MTVSESDAKIIGAKAHDRACYPAPAGDVNGDSYEDILIVAPGADSGALEDNGIAHLLHGPLSGDVLLSDPNSYAARFVGLESDDQTGGTHVGVSTAGDVNGDGFDDILIGAHWAGEGNEGAAYLFYGPVSGTLPVSMADATFSTAIPNAKLGYCTSAAGDVNGDGLEDVLVSAVGQDDFAGRSYLFYGPVEGEYDVDQDASAVFFGENAWDYSGGFAFGVGDVDGDLMDDILIGSGYYDLLQDGTEYVNVGAAYLIYGGRNQ